MPFCVYGHDDFFNAVIGAYNVSTTTSACVEGIADLVFGKGIYSKNEAFGEILQKLIPPMDWVEFLIPLSIVITAATNVGVKKFNFKSKFPLIYFLALFFGLVHGMGFGYGLKSLLGKGTELLMPLLAFNVGLEIGQLVVVVAILS